MQTGFKGELSTGGALAGVSRCIMFHGEHGVFTVTATSPAYRVLSGLDLFSKWIRYHQIADLKNKVEPETEAHIKDHLAKSLETLDAFNIPPDRRDERWLRSFDQDKAVHVSGSGATFDSLGNYKVACVLDFCRFSMDRNDAGNAAERDTRIPARGGNHPQACAEWELWLVKLANGPVQPRPPRVCVPYKRGMPHSNTFPMPDQSSTPAASRHKARMMDVPNLTPLNSNRPLSRDHRTAKRPDSWDHTIYNNKKHDPSKQRPAKTKRKSNSLCCC